jgi:hypothetical protein
LRLPYLNRFHRLNISPFKEKIFIL